MAGRKEAASPPRRPGWTKAAVLCFLVWLVFASLYHLTSRHRRRGMHTPQSPSQSNPCTSSESIVTLEAQIASFSAANADLEVHVARLTSQIEDADRRREEAEKKRVASASMQKAGPFGTVKASRTSPIVVAAGVRRNEELARVLAETAVDGEVVVTLANSNVKDMLRLWDAGMRRAGVRNRVVMALDEGVEAMCRAEQVPVYRPRGDAVVEVVGRNGSNHEVSALKFRLLREVLELGFAALVSDTDVVFLRSPLEHLYRDSDVEAMSDGDTNQTAYGYNDVFDDPPMGWARFAHTMRIWVYNSGFFYIRPTLASIELLDRVAMRLQAEPKAWDQAVFNEELFFPSHPSYLGLHASKRTMDMYDFMNSKVLFKHVRHDKWKLSNVKPVVVHINSHPEKIERMRAVVEFYLKEKKNALEPFADGSGMSDVQSS